jgi:uncharacterized ion transporter superfamily protein YfcC
MVQLTQKNKMNYEDFNTLRETWMNFRHNEIFDNRKKCVLCIAFFVFVAWGVANTGLSALSS